MSNGNGLKLVQTAPTTPTSTNVPTLTTASNNNNNISTRVTATISSNDDNDTTIQQQLISPLSTTTTTASFYYHNNPTLATTTTTTATTRTTSIISSQHHHHHNNNNIAHPNQFFFDDSLITFDGHVEEDSEDFDVSLSNLCLGGTNNLTISSGIPYGNGNNHPTNNQSSPTVTMNKTSSNVVSTANNNSNQQSISTPNTVVQQQQQQQQTAIDPHHHHHHHQNRHHQQHTHQQQDHNNNLNNIAIGNLPLLNQLFSLGAGGSGCVSNIGGGAGGGGGGGNNSNSNVVLGGLSEMIKVEDEFHIPTNQQHQQQQHHHQLPHLNLESLQTSLTSNANDNGFQSSEPNSNSNVQLQRSMAPRSNHRQQHHHQQSAPSPSMLMNHLDLCSTNSASNSNQISMQRSNANQNPNNNSNNNNNNNTASTTMSSTSTSASHHQHHSLLHPTTTGFNHNELFYSDNTNEDSCQSSLASVDSSTIVHNTKSLVLQSTTVVMPVNSSTTGPGGNVVVPGSSTQEEKLVSKRIRFKSLLEQKHQHQDQQSTEQQEQQQQQQQHPQQNLDPTADQQLDLNAVMLEQNPFAYRPTSDSLNDIYSSRNVANCYSYAWRRWSKTDAPSVKNRAGTVQVPHTMPRIDEDGRKFQYILGAPTSAGTKIGLMTMTYLNQGQSYEIRLKKLKKSSQEPNLKTSVRLGFVEKRLQYRENEELSGWVMAHNNGRMVDIDFSMSYGVFDVDLHASYNHSITFVWNPGREASIFIKINCISTEFTSKRHGGERGTPFRLIVDTFNVVDNTKLDSACCLIKVFKSKGAERKHKTDRDRVAKHPDSENCYQPSYDCTLLTTYKEEEEQLANQPDASHHDHTNESIATTHRSTESPCGSETSVNTTAPHTPISPTVAVVVAQQMLDQPPQQQQQHHIPTMADNHGCGRTNNNNNADALSKLEQFSHYHQQQNTTATAVNVATHPSSSSSSNIEVNHNVDATISSPNSSSISVAQLSSHNHQHHHHHHHSLPHHQSSHNANESELRQQSSSSLSSSSSLPLDAGAIETYEWLRRNRFFRLAEQLCDYTAEDLRRLSRDDLIQLCDLKDGIRLYNLIHTPQIDVTKLTIFITLDGNEHYALYFKKLTVEEFREKLIECFKANMMMMMMINQHEQQGRDNDDGTGTGAAGVGVTGGSINNNSSNSEMIRVRHIHMTGPNRIRVKLTNNVIQNMKNESIYICSINKVNDEYDVVIELIN